MFRFPLSTAFLQYHKWTAMTTSGARRSAPGRQDDHLNSDNSVTRTARALRRSVLSSGWSPHDCTDDRCLGQGYRARADYELMKLALRGVTVIVSSGDQGANSLGPRPMDVPKCRQKLSTDWPSNSPYVTSVGSTYITPLSSPDGLHSSTGIRCGDWLGLTILSGTAEICT